jgi:uncharacterized radical SAM protein YgiQ
MFLPTTREEMAKLKWRELDLILVTGDAYVDHPSFGVALLGHYLVAFGFKVGVIAQPDWRREDDITRLGRPRLFFGVTAGSVDSMVANYTASKKKRRTDDFTPGGWGGRRPDRATIVYANLIRRFFPGVPIVLGGLEASLRRFAHYDFWDDRIRKSVLLDAKADLLVYGMGERTVLEITRRLERGERIENLRDLPGIVYATGERPKEGVELPSYEEILTDKSAYARAVRLLGLFTDPHKKIVLFQKQDHRYIVQNPPAAPLSQEELDRLYLLPFEREVHPYYARQGRVRAIDMVRFSITAVRGCFGECAFCALTAHQGTQVVSRSIDSIVEEAKTLTRHPLFRGTITDVGGPTANMYGARCRVRNEKGQCERLCLFPRACPSSIPDHKAFLTLLHAVRSVPRVRNVFVSSGIRHDLVLADQRSTDVFVRELLEFTPGQLKLAPEHAHPQVLRLMRKPPVELFLEFKRRFEESAREKGKKRYVIGYFIVAHPGEGKEENAYLRTFIEEKLGYRPQQIQIFTPTPGTESTAMYYAGIDPLTGEEVYVERSLRSRNRMKENVLLRPRKS